nr:Pycsar system effector family protein [uncultured Desulfobacter sp.]
MDYTKKSNFLFEVIKRYDHYIGTTNYKTALIMSFLVALILGLTIRMLTLSGGSTPHGIAYYAVAFVIYLTVFTSLIVIFHLLRVIFPDTRNPNTPKSLMFFGDVSNCEDGINGYFIKINSTEEDEYLKDISSQTYVVAGIVNRKFRILQLAINITKYCVLPLLAVSLFLLVFIKV